MFRSCLANEEISACGQAAEVYAITGVACRNDMLHQQYATKRTYLYNGVGSTRRLLHPYFYPRPDWELPANAVWK